MEIVGFLTGGEYAGRYVLVERQSGGGYVIYLTVKPPGLRSKGWDIFADDQTQLAEWFSDWDAIWFIPPSVSHQD